MRLGALGASGGGGLRITVGFFKPACASVFAISGLGTLTILVLGSAGRRPALRNFWISVGLIVSNLGSFAVCPNFANAALFPGALLVPDTTFLGPTDGDRVPGDAAAVPALLGGTALLKGAEVLLVVPALAAGPAAGALATVDGLCSLDIAPGLAVSVLWMLASVFGPELSDFFFLPNGQITFFFSG